MRLWRVGRRSRSRFGLVHKHVDWETLFCFLYVVYVKLVESSVFGEEIVEDLSNGFNYMSFYPFTVGSDPDAHLLLFLKSSEFGAVFLIELLFHFPISFMQFVVIWANRV